MSELTAGKRYLYERQMLRHSRLKMHTKKEKLQPLEETTHTTKTTEMTMTDDKKEKEQKVKKQQRYKLGLRTLRPSETITFKLKEWET